MAFVIYPQILAEAMAKAAVVIGGWGNRKNGILLTQCLLCIYWIKIDGFSAMEKAVNMPELTSPLDSWNRVQAEIPAGCYTDVSVQYLQEDH